MFISPGYVVSSNLLSGQEEAISGASVVLFYHNDPFFTGQKTRVCVLAAAKYSHPNYVLRDQVYDQMASLQTHWANCEVVLGQDSIYYQVSICFQYNWEAIEVIWVP